MWRFLRNRRLILRLHYYLGTHILGASRGGPCDSTALVLYSGNIPTIQQYTVSVSLAIGEPGSLQWNRCLRVNWT